MFYVPTATNANILRHEMVLNAFVVKWLSLQPFKLWIVGSSPTGGTDEVTPNALYSHKED